MLDVRLAPWAVIAIGTVAMALTLRWAHRSIALFWYLMLPGTIAHEALHWAVATVTGGHPGPIDIIPQKLGKGRYRLGEVPIRNCRWYNAGLIGMAPLLLVPIVYLLITRLAPEHALVNWPRYLAVCYLCAVLLAAAPPSGQDFRLASISWLPTLITLAAFVVWFFVA